jgi:hypothetical protein
MIAMVRGEACPPLRYRGEGPSGPVLNVLT